MSSPAFGSTQQGLDEIKALLQQLDHELKALNQKLKDDEESSEDISNKISLKKAKIDFLKAVKEKCENSKNSLSLAKCIKVKAVQLPMEDRYLIVKGTFSRVKSFLCKALGSPRTVDALFTPHKTKITDKLIGNDLIVVKLENLKIDLLKERYSILPTTEESKERKLLKYKFLEDLLNDYQKAKNDHRKAKKNNPEPSLLDSYERQYNALPAEQKVKLFAGRKSRVEILLRDLELRRSLREKEYENLNYLK